MISFEWLKFIDVAKLPLRWWAIIAVFTFVLLFVPEEYSEIFGIGALRTELRPYLGIIALLSLAILLVNGCLKIWNIYDSRRKTAEKQEKLEKQKQKIIESLDKLSIYEASILMVCHQQNCQTINLRVDDAYARSLVDKGLIKRIGGYGDMYEWPHTVNDFIWDHIPSLFEKFGDKHIEQALKHVRNPWR